MMQLDAYLHIAGGRCEEALEFYKSVFGGSFDVSRFGDGPPGHDMPADWKNKVMHSTFKGDGITFMASDGMSGSNQSASDSNVSLTISTKDVSEGERIFNGLASGGTVEMPFEKTFWGATFGMLVDRFGIHWMVNSG